VKVCGIYLFVFLSTPCFEILLLLLFWRGSCLLLFSMLFDWSTFFYASLSIFSMTTLSFLQEEKSLWNLEYLFLVDGWHVLHNSQCRS
jgi:hypothetical protein